MKNTDRRTPRELLLNAASRNSARMDRLRDRIWDNADEQTTIKPEWRFIRIREFFSAHPIIYSGLAASWLAIAFLQIESDNETVRPKDGQAAWALFRAIPESDLNALADFATLEPELPQKAVRSPHSKLRINIVTV
ncbi:MAG: hypothetical protein JWN25_2849 [Verrucomicrobiales bacterium]|nr:hypothetical protein [Verrucomicrobiales bacterium]